MIYFWIYIAIGTAITVWLAYQDSKHRNPFLVKDILIVIAVISLWIILLPLFIFDEYLKKEFKKFWNKRLF